MLIGGMVLLAFMATVGAGMSNYAWREAQWEELRAAMRAAAAAAGTLLSDTLGSEAEIKQRVADFTAGLLSGMTVGTGDIDVSYDAGTEITTIEVVGTYRFSGIWGFGGGEHTISDTMRIRVETDRYETAVALDISGSMEGGLDDPSIKRIDALRTAMDTITTTLQDRTASTPGSLMVSIVPFTTAVNVADTCNAAAPGMPCRAARSAGKERYVRMLAGVRDTMAETLADARLAKTADEGGHWVDAYHHYGVGAGLGPLRRQFLPDDLLNDIDWYLRRENVSIDVSTQIPEMGTWVVNDRDFWNGCVMARWGAYWDPDARPTAWNGAAASWPATKAVAAWGDGNALPASTPLHLSDAPPVASDPHSLFTAYSWPDARVSGDADHLLQGTMMEMFHPNGPAWSATVVTYRTGGDNDWSVGQRGHALCPETSIQPLTDDLTILGDTIAGLQTAPLFTYQYSPVTTREIGGTYLVVGLVWGLRTLSPLWSAVWDVTDAQGLARPATQNVQKSVLLVTDGTNWAGNLVHTRTPGRVAGSVYWESDPYCYYRFSAAQHQAYHAAAALQTSTGFNAAFRTPTHTIDYVDAAGRLNHDGREAFADAYLRMESDTANSVRKAELMATLTTAGGSNLPPTPWQLFRGRDGAVVDALVTTGTGFDMTGRPVLIDNRCGFNSLFGAYGRVDDRVYMGDTGIDALTPPVPVDAAPLEVTSLPSGIRNRSSTGLLRYTLERRLDDWLLEACRIVGLRDVRVDAIYIGRGTGSTARLAINVLEQCVDAAGGTPGHDDVYLTPSAATLADAFADLFTVRRNLRFLD
ncbi:MAG: hypothetical protein F4029_09385 [Gammaproteobacteria bacterium]|nr:hypothetical protein [Gammaproteobacteria bacterium]MYF27274.1 hypothetical protein [Gammaproteobacteria bacterium]MYK46429.1 hypothetical protein [Gammaproteobacteria bacterium]